MVQSFDSDHALLEDFIQIDCQSGFNLVGPSFVKCISDDEIGAHWTVTPECANGAKVNQSQPLLSEPNGYDSTTTGGSPQCPQVMPGQSGSCGILCLEHDECPRGRLCCFNGCGRECIVPELPPEPLDKFAEWIHEPSCNCFCYRRLVEANSLKYVPWLDHETMAKKTTNNKESEKTHQSKVNETTVREDDPFENYQSVITEPVFRAGPDFAQQTHIFRVPLPPMNEFRSHCFCVC